MGLIKFKSYFRYAIAERVIAVFITTLSLSACVQTPPEKQGVIVSKAPAVVLIEEKYGAHYLNAIKQMQRGEYSHSQRELLKLVTLVPDQPEYWGSYALSQYKTGDLDGALKSVNKALGMNALLEAVINLKAVILIELGRVEEAEKWLLPALTIYPSNPKLNYNLAYVYDIYFQDLAKAAHYYEQYLEIETEDSDVANWLKQIKAR
ncbi:MAG: tetratricopeptide repeat protein [Pseudomonadales bacterium]|nr:tetratricopeptide repeat protein [Pseudomonadales bacterium]